MRLTWGALGLVAALAMGTPAPAASAEGPWTVASPNGELTFELTLGDGLSYTVGHRHDNNRSDVLLASPLGVRRDDQAFVNGLKFIKAAAVAKIDETYTVVHGKRRTIHHQARQQTFSFANGSGAIVELIVQVANDGVAFRYRFPGSGAQPTKLVEELTGFSVPKGATAWMQEQQPPTRYQPAYEAMFAEVAAGTAAPTPSGWAFPALFKIADGRDWLLITEADVNETNCATRLATDATDGRYHIRLPESGEGKGVGEVEPQSKLPWTLPWRVLIVGSTPSVIAESTLVEDVSAPSVLKDTSWIKPGRVSWSWWSDDNSPRNETALNNFTDLAAEMGWEYSLIDANWNLMDPAALQRVLAHAREKKIGMLLWYNSGGPHNDVTEQPRDRMHQREARRKEFAQLQQWGVKGVKVDFWQSDKQDRIQQYIELMKDAADFHLMVDFHGCTLPRGWSRTYPQLMTMEAVPGAEQYKFNEKYAAKAPWHNVVLAYTRNVVGGMDYTPVTFTDHKYPRVTTDGHELALSVVFESGLQHFADSVASYHKLPAEASAFLKVVPASWQESRLLGGEPGKLAVFARRGSDGWYVGGISGDEKAQSFELNLSFLGDARGDQTMSLITDGDGPRHLATSTRLVKASDKIRIELQPRGGFVARIASAAGAAPASATAPTRGAAAAASPAPAAEQNQKRVLIVMDEREQMETLAKYLKDKGGIESTIVDQKSVPDDWSSFAAVIGFVHGALQEPVELKIIDYTRNGGRYVCLHHMISSGKSKNKYYFDFLGVKMTDIDKSREPAEPGGHYAWREPVDITVVNLNPTHYITSHDVTWPDKTTFRADGTGPEREYPSFTERGEAYMNVFFSDTDKTVLLGLKYLDDRNSAQYMQRAEGWLKASGKGWIVYLQPGHFTQEFEQPAVSQMILNAITWQPKGAKKSN